MTRIVAHMVVRNERDRYLEDVLEHLVDLVDAVHIVDDRSDDGTYEWLMDDVRHRSATQFMVERRHASIPSFAEDETEFRQWAWWMTSQVANVGDWVLAVDADEVLASSEHRPATNLRAQLEAAVDRRAAQCFRFKVLEVFGFDDGGVPQIRMDGAWGGIGARRLVQFQDYMEFTKPTRGRRQTIVPSDSLPWAYGPGIPLNEFVLLHFGYATDEDRRLKAQRYAADRRHTRSHIASIMTRPRVYPWRGPVL